MQQMWVLARSSLAVGALGCLGGTAVAVACQQSTTSPPTVAHSATQAAAPAEPAIAPPPTTPASAAPATSAAPTPSASASAEPPAPPAPPEPERPALLDDAGEPLPQTEDRPTTDSPFFAELGRKLFEAIQEDDPEIALPYFFPAVAYEQVKAIAKPRRDWETRLVRLFERDIHDYRMQLGKYRHEMEYVGIEVPEDRAAWMKPHSEGNKLGYWRVLRSHLIYKDRAGRRRRLEITSMISWRGEWYIVHLNGFK